MKQIIATNKAPGAIGPYSQGTVCGNLVFTSGQLGINPETGKLAGQSIDEQTMQALKNLGEVLKAGGADYEEIVYEGYAPGGVGLIIQCLTDHRNRAAADVRSTLSKGGGSLASNGSVSFNFTRKGQIIVPAEGADYDKVFEVAAEAGAEDVSDDEEVYTVTTEPSELVSVRSALQEAGIEYDSAETALIPGTEIELDLEGARKVGKLIDTLDDLDDVQNIYSNWTATEEVMKQLAAE